jgi:glycosyltransferase involved in cell wall biosynthesis
VSAERANLHVCFVAPGAYGALAGRPELRHIGGAEVQQRLLARELVRRGHPVTFVTLDHGQPDGVVHDGVRVMKTCGEDAGLPGLRFLYPRWTSLCAALGRADADVYYQRGGGIETGQVALWARRNHRRFVFATASDTNCVPELPDLPVARERIPYRFGLRRADRVVCQTVAQRNLLARNFGVDAELIRSCSEDPLGDGAIPRDHPPLGPRVLWVGRFSPQKRPELLLELATLCPDVPFEVVGGRAGDGSYAAGLVTRARSLANVTLHGWVPPDEVGVYYDRASVLLCTSPVEGFPNTFLEAWSRGVPTVSTVDPDGLIETRGLGAVGRTAPELAAALAPLHREGALWSDCSRRARAYYLSTHTVGAAVDAYEALFAALVPGVRRW